MKLKKVFLMSGPPASGKSTFVQQNMNPATDVWCSRDQVRFSMVSENEEYFAREHEVFDTWINMINQALANPNIENIFADATHLNKASRLKTLNHLNLENAQVIPVVMRTNLSTCLKRNQKRQGRECVPNAVIRRMFNTRTNPTQSEFKYSNVIYV